MKKGIRTAKDITYIGLMASTLTVLKFALSWLANVELVTLLVVFYVCAFGLNKTICACNIFICVETLIYGFAPWVVSYIIHWNALAIAIWLLRKKGVKKEIYYALCATFMTALFGLQTCVVEVIFFSLGVDFIKAIFLRYAMGITFFGVHIVSSFLTVSLLLPPLLKIPVLKKD